MAELDMTQADLARAVKTSTAMVSILLNEQHPKPIRSSRLWPKIVSALGGVAPTVSDPSGEDVDEYRRVILDHLDELTAEQRAIVSQLVLALTNRKKP